MTPAERAALDIGQNFADYRIEELAGRQRGVGRVYVATHLESERHLEFPPWPVALKVFSPPPGQEEEFRVRFEAAAKLQAGLHHPNIVSVYEVGTDPLPFMSMTLFRGPTLCDLVASRVLDETEILPIVDGVADALDEGIQHGLLYRRLRPGGVLVATHVNRSFLADFGVGRATRINDLFENEELGTFVDYISPEEVRSAEVSERSLVYSLATIVFECLTGEPPYPHQEGERSLHARLEYPPRKLRDLRPDMPDGLESVLARALDSEPRRRPASPGQLANAIRSAYPERRRAPRLRAPTTLAKTPPLAAPEGARPWPRRPPQVGPGHAAAGRRAAAQPADTTAAPAAPAAPAADPAAAPSARADPAAAAPAAQAAATAGPAARAAAARAAATRAAATRAAARAAATRADATATPAAQAAATAAAAAKAAARAAATRAGATAAPAAHAVPIGQRRPGGRRSKLVRSPLILLVALLMAGAAVAGALLAPDPTADPADTPAEELAAGSANFLFPGDWARIGDAPAVPGTRLRDPVAVAPEGSGSESPPRALVTGHATLDELPRGTAAQTVDLGGVQAFRHEDLKAGSGRMNLYVVPTTGDAIVVACLAPSASDAFLDRCERVASTLELSGGDTAVSLAPSPAYARELRRVVGRLDAARTASRTRLQAARTRAGQRANAARLASAYRAATGSARKLTPPPGAREVHARIVAGLSRAATAYREMADAADARAAGSWVANRRAAVGSENALQAALNDLRDLGYRPQPGR
jgi:hypothetical protein